MDKVNLTEGFEEKLRKICREPREVKTASDISFEEFLEICEEISRCRRGGCVSYYTARYLAVSSIGTLSALLRRVVLENEDPLHFKGMFYG